MLVGFGQATSAFLCLHKLFGYVIVLVEILRITLVTKSGETHSFVLCMYFYARRTLMNFNVKSFVRVISFRGNFLFPANFYEVKIPKEYSMVICRF